MAAALDRDRLALERIGAVALPGTRLDAAIHAERGHRRRIARLADQPGDVIGLGLDELHVAHGRADVLGSDIAAAERLHVPAVRAEDRLAIANLVVADDHALAAAEI